MSPRLLCLALCLVCIAATPWEISSATSGRSGFSIDQALVGGAQATVTAKGDNTWEAAPTP